MAARLLQQGTGPCADGHTLLVPSPSLKRPTPPHPTPPTLRLSLCVSSLASGAGPSTASMTLLVGCVDSRMPCSRLCSILWKWLWLRAAGCSRCGRGKGV